MLASAAKRSLGLISLLPLLLLPVGGCGQSDTRAAGRDAGVVAATSTGDEGRVAMPASLNTRRDVQYGALLYAGSCSTCHGPRARGMPHRGADLVSSSFIARRDDRQLLEFLKKGRLPGDPESVQGLLMPPRGGNPALDDARLSQIVAFLRQIQQEATVAQVSRE